MRFWLRVKKKHPPANSQQISNILWTTTLCHKMLYFVYSTLHGPAVLFHWLMQRSIHCYIPFGNVYLENFNQHIKQWKSIWFQLRKLNKKKRAWKWFSIEVWSIKRIKAEKIPSLTIFLKKEEEEKAKQETLFYGHVFQCNFREKTFLGTHNRKFIDSARIKNVSCVGQPFIVSPINDANCETCLRLTPSTQIGFHYHI